MHLFLMSLCAALGYGVFKMVTASVVVQTGTVQMIHAAHPTHLVTQ